MPARCSTARGDAVEIAHGLATEFAFDTVVVTRGLEGAVALHDGSMYEQDVFEADTFDAIGTGDAFVGGFIASACAVVTSCSPAVGSATAALKRTTDGDLAVTTRAEVRSVIDGESGINR